MSGYGTPIALELSEAEKIDSSRCPPSIDEKALIRKLDFKILPILFVVYIAAFLDRYVCQLHHRSRVNGAF